MTAVNGEMIALARESRGWSQNDLASALGVSQASVSKYEIGSVAVPEQVVRDIGRVLRYDTSLFYQHESIYGIGGDFLYRSRKRVPAALKRQAQANANIRRLQVKRLLRSSEVLAPDMFPHIPVDEVGGRPEVVAQEVRKILRIPSGPIRNLTRIAERAGAIVFHCDFGTNQIDGTNIRLPGEPPLLFLNSESSGERLIFSLAHEIGHLVMHFTSVSENADQEADVFASELLMPRSEIRSDLRNFDLNTALRLKATWRVSAAALIQRALQLGIISQDQQRRFYTKMNATNMRAVEPLPIEKEVPEAFDALVRLHKDKMEMDDTEMYRLLYTDEIGSIPVPPMLRLTEYLPFAQEG